MEWLMWPCSGTWICSSLPCCLTRALWMMVIMMSFYICLPNNNFIGIEQNSQMVSDWRNCGLELMIDNHSLSSGSLSCLTSRELIWFCPKWDQWSWYLLTHETVWIRVGFWVYIGVSWGLFYETLITVNVFEKPFALCECKMILGHFICRKFDRFMPGKLSGHDNIHLNSSLELLTGNTPLRLFCWFSNCIGHERLRANSKESLMWLTNILW